MPTVKPWQATYVTVHYFRRECPQGDGRGRGPSIHLAQTDSDIQYVDWESFVADPADGSATIVPFVAARHLSRELRRRAVRGGVHWPQRHRLGR
eukprot:3628792-Pyramimonas_sp.AAC.1